jgi:hypothetical protein
VTLRDPDAAICGCGTVTALLRRRVNAPVQYGSDSIDRNLLDP